MCVNHMQSNLNKWIKFEILLWPYFVVNLYLFSFYLSVLLTQYIMKKLTPSQDISYQLKFFQGNDTSRVTECNNHFATHVLRNYIISSNVSQLVSNKPQLVSQISSKIIWLILSEVETENRDKSLSMYIYMWRQFSLCSFWVDFAWNDLWRWDAINNEQPENKNAIWNFVCW